LLHGSCFGLLLWYDVTVHVFMCVVHEPKWSLILASTGAVFAMFGRLFSTQYMMDNRQAQLEIINRTLDMKKIAHLDPYKAYPYKPANVEATA